MSGFRLANGGVIDRTREIGFRFDGRAFTGFAGDTLASALIANGVDIVGRSFKYHRPRGILSAGSEEPNALVELRMGARREPNAKATMVELFDGLEATSQNRWPSLRFDALAINQMASRFLGAGFYYKTFMWPAAFWEKVYEPMIRHAAGLGRATAESDPDRYERAHAFCDVLVIGAGPAGLNTALSAARSGARVILADEDFRPGGRLLSDACEIDGVAGEVWATRVINELEASPNVRVMWRTTIFGVYDGGTYGALERVGDHRREPADHTPRQRYWKIVAKQSVLATGASERPLMFAGNDRPGVMLAGAVRTYMRRFAAAPGRRIGVYTMCDDGWETAFAAAAHGVETPVIVDGREIVGDALTARAGALGIAVHLGAHVRAAHARRGALDSVDVVFANGGTARVELDCLAMSGGWNPTIALTGHLGARPVWDARHMCFVARAMPPGMRVTGAAQARFSMREIMDQSRDESASIARDCGSFTRTFTRQDSTRGKAFVDFQNDVTTHDIEIAHADGYRAVELLKRYTTLGMGTDQGRTGNVQGLAIMAALCGQGIESAGVTTFRPPFSPVAIGALAGTSRAQKFRPTRRTPAHDFAASRGARFVETGLWLRAQYFGSQDNVSREVQFTRARAGFCDVSTLGKFEIFGPDAGAFLDRVYANAISGIPLNRARYALMLREDGFVFDDGTVSRLAPTRFLASCSTGNTARVYEHFEFCRQVLWPKFGVRIIKVTDQWAQFSLAGPHARYVLADILQRDFDVSNAALPFMGARETRIKGGIPARVFRISFSGELAYEIAVPANNGHALAEMLERAGAAPYGLDALDAMRIEKGHPSDTEINGQTTAFDLGLARLLSTQKDFIGRAMATRPALNDPQRQQLVGVRPLGANGVVLAGAHLARAEAPASADNDEGYVTSACFSPETGSAIGLALLTRGRERHGEIMTCVDPLRNYETIVQICSPVFIDAKGERARG